MIEAKTGLEQERFVVYPDSMKGMKSLKSEFGILKQDYPYLSGLGFFGSRTKGKEHEGSDLMYLYFIIWTKWSSLVQAPEEIGIK